MVNIGKIKQVYQINKLRKRHNTSRKCEGTSLCTVNKKTIINLKIKVWALAFFAAMQIFMSAIYSYAVEFPLISHSDLIKYYFGTSLGVLLICIIVCFSAIKSTFSDILRFKLGCDTIVCITAISSAVQLVFSYIFLGQVGDKHLLIFAAMAVISLFFNEMQKLFTALRVWRNSKFTGSKREKYKISVCNEEKMPIHLSINKLAYRDKVENNYKFDQFTENCNKNDNIIHIISVATISIAGVVGCLSAFLNYSPLYVSTAVTFCLFMCSPLCMVLNFNCHLGSISKMLLKKGAMLAKIEAISEFSQVNSVVIDEMELYPANNIILKKIKTFRGSRRIDEAILYAAAAVCKLDGTISKVFDKIIMGRRRMLTEVSDIVYKDGQGVIGSIDGQRVLVGNRELIKSYGVDPPSRDYELRNAEPGQGITYFAIGEELVAMFVMDYTPNPVISHELSTLWKCGVRVFVRTVDSNVTIEKVSRDFSIPKNYVTILKNKDSQNIRVALDSKDARTTTGLLFAIDRYSAFLSAICACMRAKFTLNLAMYMGFAQLAFGAVLVAILGWFAGFDQIGEIELILYTAFWCLAGFFVRSFFWMPKK